MSKAEGEGVRIYRPRDDAIDLVRPLSSPERASRLAKSCSNGRREASRESTSVPCGPGDKHLCCSSSASSPGTNCVVEAATRDPAAPFHERAVQRSRPGALSK